MGTRCVVEVLDEDGEQLVCLFGMFDGFYDSVGKDLHEFVSKFTIVNGLSHQESAIANGMGCLALQLVSHLKKKPGVWYALSGVRSNEKYHYVVQISETDKTKAVVYCLVNHEMVPITDMLAK